MKNRKKGFRKAIAKSSRIIPPIKIIEGISTESNPSEALNKALKRIQEKRRESSSQKRKEIQEIYRKLHLQKASVAKKKAGDKGVWPPVCIEDEDCVKVESKMKQQRRNTTSR